MSTEWNYLQLGELCSKVTYGFTTPMPTSQGKDDPYLVTAKDIKDGKINYATARRTTWDAFKTLLTDKSRPNKGDVLLTKDGSIGRLAICDRDDICINQSVALLQMNGKAKSEFIKYLLESPHYQRKMEGDSDGTTIKHIYITRVDKMKVPFPPYKEQKAIAHILGTLDEKIELNKKHNQIIEDIAKTLFKSWFIDFDPVTAKAEGRSTGLPNEISDLFPDSFEDSEIGEIPSNWKIKSLDEIATYLNGLALQKYPSKGDSSDLPVIKIAQLRKGDSNNSDKCSSDIEEKYIIRDGDILFSWSGSLLVDIWTGGIGALNQHLFKVNSDIYKKWFIFHWTKFHLQEFQRIAKSKATTLGHIQRKNLSEAKIIVPPKDLMREINAIFDTLLKREINARLESKFLFQLRDTILPKLISGEISIPDAEKMIEEVGV